MIELFTDRGEKLSQEPERIPWNVHPRPLLKRDSFLCLNGWWDFSVRQDGRSVPLEQDRIRVPFPPEALLSGIHRHFAEGAELRYESRVTIPKGFLKDGTDHLLLHIDGADQHCTVFVDNREVGTHDGGYTHFTVDITGAPESFLLTIVTRDDLGDPSEPFGKQRIKRGGMWYTPFSGLWQSVWIEAVPADYVRTLRIRADRSHVAIDTGNDAQEGLILVQLPDGIREIPLLHGRAEIAPELPRLWSPSDPFLYHFTLRLNSGDVVHSYFALREIGKAVIDGVPRLTVNGEPFFFHGLLDQGYWSDGLCTPADPLAYEDDIRLAKSLGFNTLRKHIRIEPDLFYATCDRLGMIVWQDMVNNGDYSFVRDTALPNLGILKRDDRKLHRDPKCRECFIRRMEETVEQLYSFPCILYWTIFNEGWGQFNSADLCERLRRLDNTRIIDAASGWFDQGAGDVLSVHVYNHAYRFVPSGRPVVLSECGGYARRFPGHLYDPASAYGYGEMKSDAAYIRRIEKLYLEEIVPAVKKGLCGAVYTQLSDVEDEINGMVTFDRRVVKCPADRMTAIAERLTDMHG